MNNDELYQYYKNTCSTRVVSFEEFKKNYFKEKEILPFHQWKDNLVKEDSKKHNVDLYFRPREEYYQKYGTYVDKMRKELGIGWIRNPK